MLAKKYRLPIQTVLGKNSRIIRTPYFSVKIFVNHFSYPRVGVVVSKKVSAKAARRNKLRRLIFSEAGKILFSHTQPTPQDFLIIASPKISDLKEKDIISQLRAIFDTLK